eukprot:15437244-Alexandrium_andersonii.AAC.1
MTRTPSTDRSESNRSHRFRRPPAEPDLAQAKLVAGVRHLNCAGPRTAPTLVPEAPVGCVLRHFLSRCQFCRRNVP